MFIHLKRRNGVIYRIAIDDISSYAPCSWSVGNNTNYTGVLVRVKSGGTEEYLHTAEEIDEIIENYVNRRSISNT